MARLIHTSPISQPASQILEARVILLKRISVAAMNGRWWVIRPLSCSGYMLAMPRAARALSMRAMLGTAQKALSLLGMRAPRMLGGL